MWPISAAAPCIGSSCRRLADAPTMLDILTMTVLPILLAVAAGFGIRRWRGTPSGPLATVAVDILGPALLLGNLPAGLARQGTLLLLLLGAVAVLFALGYAAAALLRIRDRDDRTAFVSAVALSNFGFFGLPLVEFTLGPQSFASALSILAFLNIPTVLVGAWLAAPDPKPLDAVRTALRQPFTWAVLLALALSALGLTLPEVVQRPLKLLGAGSIPVMLVVLGIQLAEIKVGRVSWAAVGTASVLRLLVSPAIVFAGAGLLGMDPAGMDVKAAMLQLATPAGMTPFLFMVAWGRRAGLLAAIIVVTTPLSLFTLPLVIRALG